MAITDTHDIVIGLEVHVQLATESKLFCSCPNRFGDPPNRNTCPVCLGMPGTLPVPNRRAFDLAIRAAVAMGSKLAGSTKFDRKHYFYPDLPKGYQISQYDEPYCRGGGLETETGGKSRFIALNRIHIEEDAGKLCHTEDSHLEDSLVDLNRAGTPLLEIVTEPVIRSPAEAHAFLTGLKELLQYIGVSECNMEEGSLRCDANISLKRKENPELGTKVEIKNLNSFKHVASALEFEARRQYLALEHGERISQETRLFDPDKNETFPMRSKEEAEDYRYFPEPDLPRYAIAAEWVESIRSGMGELPRARRERMRARYGLPEYDLTIITSGKEIADYFEECAARCASHKEISNWIMGDVLRELHDRRLELRDFEVSPALLASLIGTVDSGLISKKIARDTVFPEMVRTGENAPKIIARMSLAVESSESALIPLVDEAIEKNRRAADELRAGKAKAASALIGYCMKASAGKADPKTVAALINRRLGI